MHRIANVSAYQVSMGQCSAWIMCELMQAAGLLPS